VASNGYSRNGGAKADGQPYNWEDDALRSAAQQEASVDDETETGAGNANLANGAGLAIDSDTADLAGDASGADLGGHVDRSDLADTAGLAGADSAVASGSTGASRSAAGASRGAAREERIPGADPFWQAPDLSWDPLPLGMDQGWPPDPPWPAQAAAAGRSEDSLRPSDTAPSTPRGQGPSTDFGASAGPGDEGPPHPERAGAEQSDPLPPAEDRGGPL
jgi:hypothetical protein